MKEKLHGRSIYSGRNEGPVLYTSVPLLIYGGIDVNTGVIIEKGHPLEGITIKDKILIFPEAKGSTVGSYTILQLKKNNVSPAGIINASCEPIVATGVIMAKIPCVDKINISKLASSKKIRIDGEIIEIIE
ncbi:MAG: aconitase X swivel domain-containing protein [Promethearchaeota archaeon]